MATGNPGGRGLASFVATMNLCQVWLKLAKLVVLEKIFPLISSFLLFSNYLLLKLFEQTLCMPNSFEIGPLVLEKKLKIWTVNRQRAHLSFQLRWAKETLNRNKIIRQTISNTSSLFFYSTRSFILQGMYKFHYA